MTRPLLVDTDVLIDFFRGHSKAVVFVNRYSSKIVLSSIVVAELYAGAKADPELDVLATFFSIFRIITVTPDIARTRGLYKRAYGKSHGVGLADAIIAATCEVEKAELKTLNVKHYPMVKGLKPAYRK